MPIQFTSSTFPEAETEVKLSWKSRAEAFKKPTILAFNVLKHYGLKSYKQAELSVNRQAEHQYVLREQ